MSIYADDAQLYTCLQSLFSTIEDTDPKATATLLKASLAITFLCSMPAASVTIDARRSPVKYLYGVGNHASTIEVGLNADTLHCLLLGEIRLSKAIGSEYVKLKGPVWKALALGEIFQHAQAIYPGVLANNGLPAICPGLHQPH